MAIYALAYVSISEMRDSKIAAIFGEEEEVFSGKWEFLWTTGDRFTRKVDFKCKTYKTLSAAKKYANILLKDKDGRQVKLQYKAQPYFSYKRTDQPITINLSTHKLIPIDITDDWNKSIDDMIETKRVQFEREVIKLKSKKHEEKIKPILDLVR
jgi:hypothetical protein